MPLNRKILTPVLLIIGAIALFWILNTANSTVLATNARIVLITENMYSVYLDLENRGEPDTLLNLVTSSPNSVSIMGSTGENGVVIPKNSKASLSSDGVHGMLRTNDRVLKIGELLPLSLNFKNAGSVAVKAIVKPSNTTNSDAENSMIMDHSMHLSGNNFEVENKDTAPSISLIVQKTTVGDYEVKIATENFQFFEPLTDPVTHENGKGHGHLYLNGLKLQRMYSKNTTVGELPPGIHNITVTLNTNDHRAYAVDGKPVTASIELTVE